MNLRSRATSEGRSLYPAAADNERNLMHCPDELMYQAVRGGGDRYCSAYARDAAGK